MSLSASSSSIRMVEAPVATMPRTSEVLWDGRAALPFILKRKRTGAILVTKLKARRPAPATATTPALALTPTLAPTPALALVPAPALRLGSELKLVGGFPVQRLTLGEVKKVLIRAPKPVSLVFLNHDDVVLDNMSFLSEERGSFENEFAYDDALASRLYDSADSVVCDMPPLRESSEWGSTDRPTWSDTFNPFDSHYSSSSIMLASPLATTTTSASSSLDTTTRRRRRHSPDSEPPRKVSKLKLALERMNELLNRPVRRSGLNVAAGKSIVV